LPLHLLLLLLLLAQTWTVRTSRGATAADDEREGERDAEAPCEVKTVTVSTLPVLRENEFSFTGAASGSVVGGGGGGGGGGNGGGGGGGAGGGGGGSAATEAGESRLLLFVRTDLPGRISVMDDLDNTALPYFTLGGTNAALPRLQPHDGGQPPIGGAKEITSQAPRGAPAVFRQERAGLLSVANAGRQRPVEMSGTGEDISQVHWKQQWLENGTLYFHVSMTESELLAQTTQAAPREPAHVLHEHMHLLHISVMVGFFTFFTIFLSILIVNF
ncbi:unnamed protein product, partial [Tetraodon nigroviridis]